MNAAAPPPVVPGLERPEPIGQGGFGTVYAADEPAFGRRVAVKVLPDRIGDDEARRGFERECRAMGALSGHPHIVSVHRGGATERGQPYIVMDLMAGGSLADRLAEQGPLPYPDVLEIGVLLAGALETAHRAGILHLDVKPANVLVSRFAEPALGDFGISRLPGVTVTLDGLVRATANYSAPERLVGGEATVATDLYALGATLYALLAGTPAFAGGSGEDIMATAARVVRDPLPDLRLRGVPAAVAEIVERLMAKEPDRRPASALDTASLLQAAQRATGQSVTRPVVEGSRTSHPPTAPPLPVPVVPPGLAALGHGPFGAASSAPAGSAPAGSPAGSAPGGAGPPVSALPSSWPPRSPPGPSAWLPTTPAAVGAAPPPTDVPGPAWSSPPASMRPPAPSPYRPPARRPQPRRGGQGLLIGGIVAALVVVVAAVVAFVVFARSPGRTVAEPTPTVTTPPASSSSGATASGTTSPAVVPSAVAIAPGLDDPATDSVAGVLDTYVTGINDRRYADSFALFTADNPTARKGLDAWVSAESTTQITDARLLSVQNGTAGSVSAEMTFTSTQDAALGFNGQTCSTWDLVYDMTGPAPNWKIHLVHTRGDPKPC